MPILNEYSINNVNIWDFTCPMTNVNSVVLDEVHNEASSQARMPYVYTYLLGSIVALHVVHKVCMLKFT